MNRAPLWKEATDWEIEAAKWWVQDLAFIALAALIQAKKKLPLLLFTMASDVWG